ncbi:hypothetical protein [Enterobacter phage F20]|uniref:Uncharacterized protein n=1 Tax=Enterobacter phage F20 TaxID=2886900 RepID=G5DMM7_9CAUD|nr:hypothetical protein FLA17_gp82 [Enterobacter phage F20]AEQ39255.1 hypothetical protein [Enterobacter phage F20]
MSDKMIVIRNRYTGSDYAYPESRFSDLPCYRIENGKPVQTNMGRNDLVNMLEYGAAYVVGEAKITLYISYAENMKP